MDQLHAAFEKSGAETRALQSVKEQLEQLAVERGRQVERLSADNARLKKANGKMEQGACRWHRAWGMARRDSTRLRLSAATLSFAHLPADLPTLQLSCVFFLSEKLAWQTRAIQLEDQIRDAPLRMQRELREVQDENVRLQGEHARLERTVTVLKAQISALQDAAERQAEQRSRKVRYTCTHHDDALDFSVSWPTELTAADFRMISWRIAHMRPLHRRR